MNKQKERSSYVPIEIELIPTTCGDCRFFKDDTCYGVPPTPVMIQAIEYIRPKVAADDKACSKWVKS